VRFGKQYSVGQRRRFHSASRPRTRLRSKSRIERIAADDYFNLG
jgi:hypothetical protein